MTNHPGESNENKIRKSGSCHRSLARQLQTPWSDGDLLPIFDFLFQCFFPIVPHKEHNQPYSMKRIVVIVEKRSARRGQGVEALWERFLQPSALHHPGTLGLSFEWRAIEYSLFSFHFCPVVFEVISFPSLNHLLGGKKRYC